MRTSRWCAGCAKAKHRGCCDDGGRFLKARKVDDAHAIVQHNYWRDKALSLAVQSDYVGRMAVSPGTRTARAGHDSGWLSCLRIASRIRQAVTTALDNGQLADFARHRLEKINYLMEYR